jgi:hypothetical protein
MHSHEASYTLYQQKKLNVQFYTRIAVPLIRRWIHSTAIPDVAATTAYHSAYRAVISRGQTTMGAAQIGRTRGNPASNFQQDRDLHLFKVTVITIMLWELNYTLFITKGK